MSARKQSSDAKAAALRGLKNAVFHHGRAEHKLVEVLADCRELGKAHSAEELIETLAELASELYWTGEYAREALDALDGKAVRHG